MTHINRHQDLGIIVELHIQQKKWTRRDDEPECTCYFQAPLTSNSSFVVRLIVCFSLSVHGRVSDTCCRIPNRFFSLGNKRVWVRCCVLGLSIPRSLDLGNSSIFFSPPRYWSSASTSFVSLGEFQLNCCPLLTLLFTKAFPLLDMVVV